MKIIENELNIIKTIINNNIEELLPNNYLKSFVLSGSKFIRSMLAILYLKSLNFEINDNIYKILIAGEIIHSASLLHDDVLDNASLRRGKTAISKEFSSKISILAGDYLLTCAIEKLLDLDNIEILDIFQSCVKKMSKAEINQFFLRNNLPTKDEYIRICEDKTGELFSAILKSCFISLSKDYEQASDFGKIFGIYFQIKNDLEDKSAEEDRGNRVFTAKDIFGIEKTYILLDNYKKEMKNIIKNFPEYIYKKNLKDLIDSV